jgi:hypothetical protein
MLRDIQALKANGYLIEDYPEPHRKAVAGAFRSFALKYLRDKKQREKLFPQLANRRTFNLVHPSKLDPGLASELRDLKLAYAADGDDYSDLALEPATAGLYMLFLANEMSGARSLISDSSVYQSLMYARLPGAPASERGMGDEAFRLATVVLRTAMPDDIESVPIDKLLRIRDDLSKPRKRFQDKVAALAKGLEKPKSEEELLKLLETQGRRIEDEYDELVDKLRLSNVAFFTGLFALSVPGWATAGWGLGIAAMSPALAGIAAVGVSGGVVKRIFDRRAAKRSPWSYLLSVRRRLRASSFAKQITTLDLQAPDYDDVPAKDYDDVPVKKVSIRSGDGGGHKKRKKPKPAIYIGRRKMA